MGCIYIYIYNAHSVTLKTESSWAMAAPLGPQHPMGARVPKSLGYLENLSERHRSPPDPQGDARWGSVLAPEGPIGAEAVRPPPSLSTQCLLCLGCPAGRSPTDGGSCAGLRADYLINDPGVPGESLSIQSKRAPVPRRVHMWYRFSIIWNIQN